MPLKPIGPESLMFKPKSFVGAMKGPFGESHWLPTAHFEMKGLAAAAKITFIYDMPELDCAPVNTKIVCDIATKPGRSEFPSDQVLVFPDEWKPGVPYLILKCRFVPCNGWDGYHALELATSMPEKDMFLLGLSHCCRYNRPPRHHDIKQAFPEAPLEQPFYCAMPPGYAVQRSSFSHCGIVTKYSGMERLSQQSSASTIYSGKPTAALSAWRRSDAGRESTLRSPRR